MIRSLSMVLAVSLFGLVGCNNDAEEKCNQFEAAFCERVQSCTEGTSSPTTKEKCMSDLAKRADCSKAEEAPGDLDKCVAAVKALACTSLTSLPSSCDIKLRQ